MRALHRQIDFIVRLFIILLIFLGAESLYPKSDFRATEYYVKEINISGNKEFSTRKLKQQLNLKEKTFWRKQTFTRRLLELDRLMLESIYVKQGYLYCSVKDSFVVHSNNLVDIYYKISEGHSFLLKEVIVRGEQSLSEKKVIGLLNHKVGKPYNPIQIRNGIKNIITEYSNIGRPLTTVTDSLVVNSDIRLLLTIRESNTIQVNSVIIANNKLVKEKPIRRELVLKPGDLYSAKKLDLSKRHIYETGLFSSVNIRLADIDTVQDKVNLVVDVRELDMHYFKTDFGLGQNRGLTEGSEPYTSIEATGEWLNRNIAGRGSRLSIQAETSLNLTEILSQPYMAGKITWVEPWLLGFRSSNTFSLYAENQMLGEDSSQANFGGELALIYQPERRLYLKTGFSLERVNSYFPSGNYTDFERSVSLTFSRDYRDNFLFPKSGTYFSTTGKIGSIIGNANDYYKIESTFCQYLNLIGPVVLAYRAKIGIMNPIVAGKETPQYEKFYLGGTSSLRGWKESRLVTGVSGDPVGNDLKALTTAEIRFPLFWLLGGEIFIDGGNLVSDFSALTSMPYRWDAGIGLTLATPLGPIRIDYAKKLNTLNADEENNLWQIQFGIPYAF